MQAPRFLAYLRGIETSIAKIKHNILCRRFLAYLRGIETSVKAKQDAV
ncbi:hypothetical protein CDSM653_02395 [Caldanaerobacter subterraneus subsp. pacificus DSM 12653]|uniref:Uncharacterized protein n=1 Tax=Caldanaerobacter subterraneus subsp. pacificus DSM 12653 TaxID=391606 RepID=A0A0F5PIZ5_9THEO|nr:hypothetical protein CDSM653_02388 [Caldanaerobacter subterraneus subsp. pacificus DSM 12653]KKC28628.1 hypothetical protein CDSM653_02395 [Caldanaerobacter subterraneus subsp. pacificus DSM 12653]